MTEFRKEHEREHIKAVPLAAVQQEFVTQALKGKIDEAVRDKLLAELEAVVPSDAFNNYAYELLFPEVRHIKILPKHRSRYPDRKTAKMRFFRRRDVVHGNGYKSVAW